MFLLSRGVICKVRSNTTIRTCTHDLIGVNAGMAHHTTGMSGRFACLRRGESKHHRHNHHHFSTTHNHHHPQHNDALRG